MRRSLAHPCTLPLLILGLLAGLLGMHTFSAGTVGHGPSAHPSVNVATASATAHASADHGESPAAATPLWPAHPAMAMSCVLALLAGLVLIVRPSASAIIGPPPHRIPRDRTWITRSAPARPPSHVVLCISRT